jgi:hypothetical protein
MRRRLTAGAVATATGLALLVGLPTSPAAAATIVEYTVVADDGVSAAAAVAAITAAGGDSGQQQRRGGHIPRFILGRGLQVQGRTVERPDRGIAPQADRARAR